MLVNKTDQIEGYELKIINSYRLKEIMLNFAFSTPPEHRIVLGDKKEENTIFNMTGLESVLIKNLRCIDTGKTDWTYDDYPYRVYINEFDEYACPEVYKILGLLINHSRYSNETNLKMLSRLSKLCELKRMPLKKIFDEYIDEILSLIILEKTDENYMQKLNELYKLLYVKHHKDDIFPKEDFMQKYKVYKYDLKNIKKV